MNERGKSDGCVVPAKSANKAVVAAAESVEERRPAEGNMASKTRPGHEPEQMRPVRWTVCVNWHEMCVFAFGPKARAQCVGSAHWDLCGGPLARAVPTPITVRCRPHCRAASAAKGRHVVG
jgi:hypothetical protein